MSVLQEKAQESHVAELPSTMKKPEVYISWANSLLCEANRAVDNVAAVQDGMVLCELIDILAPDAGLMAKIQASGSRSQRTFIQAAIDHMKNHGIKITFTAQDIIDGDIKSLLDVMWLLILNYGIHFIGQNSSQRSVGVAKKNLLDWCQSELDVAFDPKNTLSLNLCTGNWFMKLLQKFAGCHVDEGEDKASHLHNLLKEIEERYGIRSTIISPNDIIDGTVDEHTLMIYLSLLKRRVCNTARSPRREMLSVDGKEAALARVEERNRSASEEAANRRRHTEVVGLGLQQLHQQQQQQQQPQQSRPKRSASVDSGPPPVPPKSSVQTRSQESVESSDWLSSETNSLLSGRDRSPGDRGAYLITEAENVLMQTISERVKEHLPLDQDEDKDTDASLGHSERETESMSEFSSGAVDEGYVTVRSRTAHKGGGGANGNPQQNGTAVTIRPEITVNGHSSNGNAKKSTEPSTETTSSTSTTTTPSASTTRVKIKRPKDYYLQWEETIDRLSQGPHVPPDVSDMSPRSPREILRGIEDIQSPRQPLNRSYSSESEVYGSNPYIPVWKRREYFEKRSSSHSPSDRYRRGLYSPRSSSMPLRESDSERSEASERSERSATQRRHSPRAGSSWRKSAGGRQTTSAYAESRAERRSPTENGQPPQRLEDSSNGRQSQPRASSSPGVSPRLPELNSAFMERLEELKRSGRAQRVILPDLGPDAPVLMIPGQGEEVLLLFDALRQARLEADSHVPGMSARPTTNGTAAKNGNGSKSPARTSPVDQRSEETTEVKKLAKADTAEAKASTPRRSPTQGEESDVVGRLPRPTVHRHRFSKPTDIRVTDLKTGRLRDPRRSKSLSEGNMVSPLAAPEAESFRYRSLSPKREHLPELTSDSLTRERVNLRELRDRVDAVVMDTAPFRRVKPSTVESITEPIQRSYANSASSSPVGFSPSPSSSPYSGQLYSRPYHSPSPLRVLSPRPVVIADSSGRIPLDLPDSIVSSPGRSPTRVGGLGRVPRREAWERQRQRKTEGRPFTATGTDSMAQAKFIEVLCKEIEELKQKVEIMEESSPERRSLSRGRPGSYPAVTATTTATPTATGQNDTFYTSRSEIKETDSNMVLAPKDGGGIAAPPGSTVQPTQRTRHSPRPWESSTARASTSPTRASSPRHRAGMSPRRQPHSRDQASATATDKSRSRQTASSPDRTSSRAEEAASAKRRSGADKFEEPPVSGRPISLGYKSPIRSVTQEIWGKDLTSVEGLKPDRRETYKRLISQRSLGEGDVIELKQSLASAVVENDILQAKLNNARHEIQEKLSKTNEVLDDCRRHLAKSQAENMELRTALEREKVRAETSEGRGRDLEALIKQLRADNTELEEELDHTLSILDRSKPGIDALKHENAQLHGKAAAFQNENNTLKRDIDDMRKSQFKSISTIRELRNCLDELRQERGDLQQKVSKLERTQNESKVKAILTHYNEEKGAKDEAERESNSSGVSSSSERFRTTPSSSARWSSVRNDDVTPRTSPPSKSADTSNVSGMSPGRGHNYGFDDVSPTVPSAYREIYPHRKPRFRNLSAERYGSPDRMDSPVAFIDYSDLQHYPTKLDHMEVDDYVTDEVAYRRSPLPRDNSPIRKPVAYRPYSATDNNKSTTSYSAMPDRSTETPRDRSRSRTRSLHSRGRSPVRSARTSIREPRSASASPVRVLPGDRLNRSYDSVMFDLRKQRSASSSPGRYVDSMKGILKNGTSSAGRDRDRSTSPRYGARSHSPPTRLSPTGGKDSKAAQIKMFPRTEAGEIARNLQREFDNEDCILDGLRKKHRSKSWFELQLDDTDSPSGVELAEALGEEHLLLSEEQRSYANQLIQKYTGRKL